MHRIIALAILVCATCLLVARIASATTIVVPNFSFETPSLPTDPSSSPGASGWVSVGTVLTDNPPDPAAAPFGIGGFFGAAGNGTPTGGHLAQSVLLTFGAAILSQNSLWTVQSGEMYTLTVAIGDRFDRGSDVEPVQIRVGFVINDHVVSLSDTTLSAASFSPEGAFKDFIWSYSSRPEDVGKSLKVSLACVAGTVNFDNVRVNVVPETSTLALLISSLSVAAACVIRRRNSSDASFQRKPPPRAIIAAW